MQAKVDFPSLKETGLACVDALLTGRRVLSEGCASRVCKLVEQASSVELSKFYVSAALEFKAVKVSQVMSHKIVTCLETELKVKRESNSQLTGLW